MSDFNLSNFISEEFAPGYQSPIEIISKEIESKIENDTFSIIQEYGINVDKEELLKALRYDREQYSKGYADAIKDHSKKGVWEFITEDRYHCVCKCSNCGRLILMPKQGLSAEEYAPHCFCGADMC